MVTVLELGSMINRKIECQECKSLLQYSNCDIKQNLKAKGNGSKHIKCPACGATCYLGMRK